MNIDWKWKSLTKLSEISNFQSFENEVIWQTPIHTKWYQLQLSSMYLVKVMAIIDFFQEFLKLLFKKIPKF
jgi:hypothetical protein